MIYALSERYMKEEDFSPQHILLSFRWDKNINCGDKVDESMTRMCYSVRLAQHIQNTQSHMYQVAVTPSAR